MVDLRVFSDKDVNNDSIIIIIILIRTGGIHNRLLGGRDEEAQTYNTAHAANAVKI